MHSLPMGISLSIKDTYFSHFPAFFFPISFILPPSPSQPFALFAQGSHTEVFWDIQHDGLANK